MEFPQRFEIPIRYIQAHYEPDDRLCVALIKRHGEQSAIRQEFLEAREICKPKYQARLRAANAQGADIYVMWNWAAGISFLLTPVRSLRGRGFVDILHVGGPHE